MSNSITQIKVGTRGSKLALKQAKLVIEKFKSLKKIKEKFSFKIIKIRTEGDINKSKILDAGYKGFFTKKIDDLLLKGKIDLAVHSAKDIPSKIERNIIISAFLKREDPRDILFSKNNYSFKKLPKNIVIGTSSIRRKTQIQNLRPDLNIKYMRGNIETRIRKFKNNNYFAIILALAGVKRLGLKYKKKNILNSSKFVPAGGQGAIAVTVLKKSNIINSLVRKINDTKTEIEVKTERKFLEKINADCDSPVGAYARIIKKSINFSITVPDPNNNRIYFYKSKGKINNPENLGIKSAANLKKELGKRYEVFFPINSQLKDIDLLIQNPKTGKSKSIQVKGSRTWIIRGSRRQKLADYFKIDLESDINSSWFKVKKNSIFSTTNKIDFFIFVTHEPELSRQNRRIKQNFLIIPLEDFKRITKNKKNPPKSGDYWYYFVVKGKKVVDTRDTKSGEPIDFSKFLNNFSLLK